MLTTPDWDRGAIDRVASYRPWHLFEDSWGIDVDAEMLVTFAEVLADEAGTAASAVAPFVLRQVLAHEYVHFGFEVAGTEIEDLLGEPRYACYVLAQYDAPNRWTRGPLEEVVATWAELELARSVARRGAPRGYARAVAAVNRRAPDGYRDFDLMGDQRRRERIHADVATLIASREVWSSRWGTRTGPGDHATVPVRWHGDASLLALFGAMPKAVAAPSIRRVEAWLSQIGATPLRGSKHAKVLLPNGRRWSYTDTADQLLDPEANRLARLLGLRGRRELFRLIAEKRVPDGLAPAGVPA